MPTILVPAPPASAFNKNRPISDLLAHQLKHFQHMEAKLPNALHSNMAPRDLLTENGAAQYIAHITNALLSAGESARPVALRKPVRSSAIAGAVKPGRTLVLAASADPSRPPSAQSPFKATIPRSASKKPRKPKAHASTAEPPKPASAEGRRHEHAPPASANPRRPPRTPLAE